MFELFKLSPNIFYEKNVGSNIIQHIRKRIQYFLSNMLDDVGPTCCTRFPWPLESIVFLHCRSITIGYKIIKTNTTVLKFGAHAQSYAKFQKITLKEKYLQIFAVLSVFDCPDTSFRELFIYF